MKNIFNYLKSLAIPLSCITLWLIISTLLAHEINRVAAAGITALLATGIIFWIRRSGQVPAPRSQTNRLNNKDYSIIAGSIVTIFFAIQVISVFILIANGSAGFNHHNEVLNAAPLWMIITVTAITAPLGEEFLMRGFVQPWLRKIMPAWMAILATAAVFSLLHGNLIQGVATIPLGILCGILYEKTGRVFPSIIVHTMFNILSILVPAQWIADLTSPTTCAASAAVIVAVLVVVWKFGGKEKKVKTLV